MTVHEIIKCPKLIERKRKPSFREENRHYRMNIELTCPNDKLSLTMILRRLIDFQEDFTVGLKLNGPNEFMESDIVILRFQGPHGGQSEKRTLQDLHNSYHIHEYTDEDLQCRRKKASYKRDADFSSFEEAIVCFLEYCNIDDPNGIFNDEKDKINQIRWNLNTLIT